MDEKIEEKVGKYLYNDLSSIMSEEYEKHMLITPSYCANKMFEKGYRKESDTVREILGLILAKEFEKGDYLTDDELKKLVLEKYGVDLEESDNG